MTIDYLPEQTPVPKFRPNSAGLTFDNTAFASPVPQTLLPIIIKQTGQCYGYYPIASHNFVGTETTYALSDGSVPVSKVTMPVRNSDGHGFWVKEFMAVVYDWSEEAARPWEGHASWIGPSATGYYTFWSMPTTTWHRRHSNGVLFDSFRLGMATFPPSAPDTPTPPDGSNGKIFWACSLSQASVQQECAFFDFPWMDTFNSSLPADKQGLLIPQSITVLTNPTGGEFKATLVTGFGGQTVYPGGAVVFNTIRILKLADPAPGDYVFTFRITAQNQLTTDVTLTLTVV